MKTYLISALVIAASIAAGNAALFTFDSNATVNDTTGSLGTGTTIVFGIPEEVYDSEWNYLGDRWVPDPAPVDSITELPSVTGYGPSDNSALNGIMQPILIIFDEAFDITSFSVFLDDSTWGNLFSTPIEFLDIDGNLITSLDSSPNIPNYEVTGSDINGVKTILLASGAMYDNMTITGSVIPEPSAVLLGGLGSLGLLMKRRRH